MTRAQQEQIRVPLQAPSGISGCRCLLLRVIPISAPRDSREGKQGSCLHVTAAGSNACCSGAKKGLQGRSGSLWLMSQQCACSPSSACMLGAKASLPRDTTSFPQYFTRSHLLGSTCRAQAKVCTENTSQGLKRLPPSFLKRQSEVVLISSPISWHL